MIKTEELKEQLLLKIKSTADKRAQISLEYPEFDSERNETAAILLRGLHEYVEALPDNHQLFVTAQKAIESHNDDLFYNLTKDLNESINKSDFQNYFAKKWVDEQVEKIKHTIKHYSKLKVNLIRVAACLIGLLVIATIVFVFVEPLSYILFYPALIFGFSVVIYLFFEILQLIYIAYKSWEINREMPKTIVYGQRVLPAKSEEYKTTSSENFLLLLITILLFIIFIFSVIS